MTYAVTLALLLEYAATHKRWAGPAVFLGCDLACTAVLGWALGLLYGTATSGGQALYGYFSMNLNALCNPAGVNGVLYSRFCLRRTRWAATMMRSPTWDWAY